METATTTATRGTGTGTGTGAGTGAGTTTGRGPDGQAPRHGLSVLVSRMRARLGEELPPVLWSMAEDELVDLLVDLQGLLAQAEAASLAAVREVDRRDLGRTAGATSTANWLSGLLRIRPGKASRRVKLARDLDTTLAMTHTALNAGDIDVEAADVIAQTIRDLPSEAGPDVRFDAERAMLDHARVFHPQDLTRIGTTILGTVDPDLADRILAKKLADDEARAARRRELSIQDDPYSTSSFLRGKLDAETADMLRTAIEPLAKPRPTDADGPDTRTASQRLGDGFHELLRRYLDSGESPTHAGEKPHLVITITDTNLADGTGHATLLRTGTPISARTAQRMACDAKVSYWGIVNGQQALTDGTRLFVGRTRRLLELRDRGCAFPGCDRPPSWCDGHHIIAWLQGGPTTVDNGVLLCGHHHRLVHQGAWHVRLADDGRPEFIPPEWIDKTRQPQRNNRLRT
ncbi:DUF222 domain-containing protein [Actinopolymorpha sp. B9G3]|uniref:HNH endonuclease signature motif containing protein n=1 Tax=Actinopolymorpha sp. B9G3 TaxID=3158970 RepID=UPI0032D90C62